MPSPEYFHRFGILTKRSALATTLCAVARTAMAQAFEVPGTVWNPQHGENLAPQAKKRKELLHLPADLESAVRLTLESERPAIEAFFNCRLTRLQPVKFTRYDQSDYYGLHRDVSREPTAPAVVRDRQISVVVFLNDQVDEPEEGCYCGGRLTFHELLSEPPFDRTGQPLDAEQGLMVAFRPDIVHEVTPVTWGSRFTLTTWWE